MKRRIEDRMLPIDKAKHLQSLGLDMSKAALCWKRQEWTEDYHPLFFDSMVRGDVVPAFTLEEIMDELPDTIKQNGTKYYLIYDSLSHSLSYGSPDVRDLHTEYGSSDMKDAVYRMLVWYLERRNREEKEREKNRWKD